MNLKQFKLTNDDEIICEVVEDTEQGLVVRRVLKVIATDDLESNIRYYAFRPWLTFQDDFDELSVLNIGHIVGETTPSKTIVGHFEVALKDVENSKKLGKDVSVEDMMELLGDDYTNDDIEDFLEQKRRDELFSDDSADAKIIHFNPGNTKH